MSNNNTENWSSKFLTWRAFLSFVGTSFIVGVSAIWTFGVYVGDEATRDMDRHAIRPHIGTVKTTEFDKWAKAFMVEMKEQGKNSVSNEKFDLSMSAINNNFKSLDNQLSEMKHNIKQNSDQVHLVQIDVAKLAK